MEPNVCPKCNGTGRIKDSEGIHTCFDCLLSGKLDNYEREIKTSPKPTLRFNKDSEKKDSENKFKF